jgi:hypothetical protein
MPVTTRSMKKSVPVSNLVRTTAIQKNPYSISVLLGERETVQETDFIQETKKLLYLCENTQGKEAKMRTALEIYKNINANLKNFLNSNPLKWNKFAACVFSKTTEFYNSMQRGEYNDIADKNLVANHFQEFMKTRNFLKTYLINLKKNTPWHINMYDKFFTQAMDEIEREISMRPRRNILRVDYTGMDTIEPESEYDGITDIWYDLTIHYDPDYVPEDEEDDEDDEYQIPEQPTSISRLKRSIKKIDYSGMDMSEEEVGTISVCSVKWNNRVPTYRWIKYPVSKANELFDEDWQC